MTSPNDQDRAWLYAVGGLEPREREQFERDLAAGDDAAATLKLALAEAEADAADLSLGTDPEAPSDKARARFEAALADDTPFAPLLGALAKLADLAEGTMRGLLEGIPDLSKWEEGPGDGVTIFHLDGGPATAGAVVGFVKIPAGGDFPEHTHDGEETTLIMQGTLVDSTGPVAGVGDFVVQPGGSTHFISAGPDEDLIFLVVVHGGVNVGGEHIGPGDPRL